MGMKNLIDGLTALQPFYDTPDGYHVGAGHDVIYAYSTDTPLTESALDKMISFGWHQEYDERDYNKDFSKTDYRHEESWHFYT